MKELNDKVEQTLVPREIFDLRVGRLENIVYGMIAIILTEVLLAAMILLLRTQPPSQTTVGWLGLL